MGMSKSVPSAHMLYLSGINIDQRSRFRMPDPHERLKDGKLGYMVRHTPDFASFFYTLKCSWSSAGFTIEFPRIPAQIRRSVFNPICFTHHSCGRHRKGRRETCRISLYSAKAGDSLD